MGKRTAKLLAEAIVLAHVEGAHWAGWHAGLGDYPKDSIVVARVLLAASGMSDLYPALSKVSRSSADG